MKTEISRGSHQPEKRYSGVYQQQGRMLTDADWNELVDILKARLNDALKDVVGNGEGSIGGTPRHRPLAIVEDGGIKIVPGRVYIDGMAATLPGTDNLALDEQPDFPEPPAVSDDYVLYADVWERIVTQLLDERLRDKALHGADTCTRKQMLVQVKWCPDSVDPETSALNPAIGDAGLTLTLREKSTDPDVCDPCAATLDIDAPVGNYLFRLEVHDVQGDADNPDAIILKWSRENGAEQFEALPTEDDMPAGFISDKYVYEFFDDTSERHLGVHLNDTAWSPARADLEVFSETTSPYAVPAISGSGETDVFVRRWDGYCTIELSTGDVTGIDQGVELSTTKAADSLGYVDVGTQLALVLNSLDVELELGGKAFVAGDYWLADVREVEHSEGSVLLNNALPIGITHYYLALGRVAGGILQENPEHDRKYAFPTLTEMTRLFMAGGDGQEIAPGSPLPQPLRVGVANGEWPVVGATVRFEIEDGGGSINVTDSGLTDDDGIARCEWSPDAVIGATCRVKATLVDPDDPATPASDLAPPVYFYANLITADQVAYENPTCGDTTTVNSLFTADGTIDWPDHDGDDFDSVKDVLDALLCKLKAGHVPYVDPECTGNTVRALLGNINFDGDAHVTVKDALDTLLCTLAAEHIPYDPTVKGSRWDDINESSDQPTTVQEAIDDIAENLESTDIRYEVPTCGSASAPTVRSKLGIAPGTTKVDAVLDELLCELKANDLPLDRNDTLCAGMAADADIKTVQDALNYLCEHAGGTGCTTTVGKGGQFASLEEAFDALKKEPELCLCLLPGEHRLERQVTVKDKTSIRITGCGAETCSILIVNGLVLEAPEIQLRDLAVIGGEAEGAPTDAGSLELRGERAHIVAENCTFIRHFRGTDNQWIPAVIVDGNARLDWQGNRMKITRVDEDVANAVLPDKDGLTGKALEAAEMLEKVFDPAYAGGTQEYRLMIEETADFITGSSGQIRNKLFNARSVDLIDGLAGDAISIRNTNSLDMLRDGVTGARLVNMDGAALVTGRTVAPNAAVAAFYDDIKAGANADKIGEEIEIVVSLLRSPDFALALASMTVDGAITRNEITGKIGLNYENRRSVPMTWPDTLDDPARQANKSSWADKHLNPGWRAQGQLLIQGNKVSAIQTLLDSKVKDQFEDIVVNGASPAVTLNAYESLSVTDNYLDDDKSSFLAKFMTFTGNQFLFEPKGNVNTLAYTVGYRGIFLGNTAFGLSNDGSIVIEQMLADHMDSVQANFLRIV